MFIYLNNIWKQHAVLMYNLLIINSIINELM